MLRPAAPPTLLPIHAPAAFAIISAAVSAARLPSATPVCHFQQVSLVSYDELHDKPAHAVPLAQLENIDLIDVCMCHFRDGCTS